MREGMGNGRWIAMLLVTLGAGGCDGVVDIDARGIDTGSPEAVPTLVNGMVGRYHEAVDDIIRFSALLSDEMIAAGTFGTRIQVDNRRIQVNNLDLAEDMYVPLHRARLMADTLAFLSESRIQDPAFSGVVDDLNAGIVLGKLYGGYTRIWLAELYCWSILTGMFPEAAPLLPDARMQQAIGFLQEAEAEAASRGFGEARLAAVVGQARAHLWLGNYAQAALLAAQVPRGFVYWAEYSNNDPAQYNEMYTFTWGDTQTIRWTVGDGTQLARGNERWEHLDEFIALNLLRNRPPGFTSFQGSIPVVLQMLYNRPESNVLVASGMEARLIRAEAAVRSGQTGVAEDLLNDLRSDYSLRATIRWGVEPPAPGNALQPIALAGELAQDLKRVVDERARELWLTGDRHTTSRRLRLDPTVDINLFPAVKAGGGDDIAFPIVQMELDPNPVLSSGDACPPGQSIGSWR